jgi:hypothetical protein
MFAFNLGAEVHARPRLGAGSRKPEKQTHKERSKVKDLSDIISNPCGGPDWWQACQEWVHVISQLTVSIGTDRKLSMNMTNEKLRCRRAGISRAQSSI